MTRTGSVHSGGKIPNRASRSLVTASAPREIQAVAPASDATTSTIPSSCDALNLDTFLFDRVAHERSADRHVDHAKSRGFQADERREGTVDRRGWHADVEFPRRHLAATGPALRDADGQHHREERCVHEGEPVDGKSGGLDDLPEASRRVAPYFFRQGRMRAAQEVEGGDVEYQVATGLQDPPHLFERGGLDRVGQALKHIE